MSRPRLELLSERQKDLIHSSSLHLIENCGIVIPDARLLRLLREHGAEIDFDTNICKLPRPLVEEFVKKSPMKIVLNARDSSKTVTVEKGGRPHFAPNMGATYVNDLETRKRREATFRDAEDFNRVIDGLKHVDFGGEIVVPNNVPPQLAQYYSWIAAMKNTSKHLIFYQTDYHGVTIAVEMGNIIQGTGTKADSSPMFSFVACLPQVLGFERSLLAGIGESARNRVPLFIQSGPASGATGPGTLAGTLVLSNAEILGGITIVQILSPGTPVVYMSYARHFDMKAENVSLASPEFALLRICQGELANYYNIPSAASGLSTDSKVLDIQAGYDKSIGLVSLISGNELIMSDSLDQGDIADLAELPINDELAAAYLRVWRGIEINEETLAIKEITRVGSGLGHNFISTKYTRDHFRTETWLDYQISERRKWDSWNRDGGKNAEMRAIERVKEILKNHRPEPLPNSVLRELESVLSRISGDKPSMQGTEHS